jgi:outer membrane protein assembly factor BamB
VASAIVGVSADNWPEWRGINRDGRSAETGLPEKWTPPGAAGAGQNVAWRVPIGARSSPVVWNNRVYLYAPAGDDATRQERLVAIDAASGKVLWEHKRSVYLSDVPVHRVAWASPSVDPQTGNIYAYGGNATLMAFSPDGKQLWERTLVEDFGAVTTHGGRTPSPVIEGDVVILNSLVAAWGALARTGNRYFAFDKKTGQTVWISSPQTRHWDTNYATPIVATIGGMRLAIVGGTDGVFHALKVSTGEPVWHFDVSKRALNNSPVMAGSDVIIAQSEENFDTSEMGYFARFDGALKGDIKKAQAKWGVNGLQVGFPTPVVDEKAGMIYLVDNGAIAMGLDLETGARLWEKKLGTLQKGSPVLADGKLYVGTENGRFYILKPSKTGVEVLDEDWLGSEQAPEPILASPVVADGRVYVVSQEALYAIGPKAPTRGALTRGPASATPAATPGPAAAVRVVPADINLKPGQAQKFVVDVFDANGTKVSGPAPAVTWALTGLKGTTAPDGTFTPDKAAGEQAGVLEATAGAIKGTARIRVTSPLPLAYDFDAGTGDTPPVGWINATGKFDVIDIEGSRALHRREDNTVSRRARLFYGTQDMANYTVEMDVRTVEKRRQQGDIGVIAQRYVMILFGNSQKVELESWQPAVKMTVSAPLQWKADTWYRVKLEAQNLKDGTTRVRGKVWPKAEPEPTAWTLEKIDKIGHRQGSPGIYADAPWGAFFDNIKVTPNTGS